MNESPFDLKSQSSYQQTNSSIRKGSGGERGAGSIKFVLKTYNQEENLNTDIDDEGSSNLLRQKDLLSSSGSGPVGFSKLSNHNPN